MPKFEYNKKEIKDFKKNIEDELAPQNAIEEIQKIKCPICGGTATVKNYNKNHLELDFCHDELKDKVDKYLNNGCM